MKSLKRAILFIICTILLAVTLTAPGCAAAGAKDARGNNAIVMPDGALVPEGYKYVACTNTGVTKPTSLPIGPHTEVKAHGIGNGLAATMSNLSKSVNYNSTATNISGGTSTTIGAAGADVSQQDAGVVGAAGTAVGNVIGAAAKTTVKP